MGLPDGVSTILDRGMVLKKGDNRMFQMETSILEIAPDYV